MQMKACGCLPFGQADAAAEQAAAASPDASNVAASSGELATTMVLRGAVGTLIGAAASPAGQEGIWGALGFVMGATLGEIGIVGVALAALWRKGGG
jgi:hypothetical protein